MPNDVLLRELHPGTSGICRSFLSKNSDYLRATLRQEIGCDRFVLELKVMRLETACHAGRDIICVWSSKNVKSVTLTAGLVQRIGQNSRFDGTVWVGRGGKATADNASQSSLIASARAGANPLFGCCLRALTASIARQRIFTIIGELRYS